MGENDNLMKDFDKILAGLIMEEEKKLGVNSLEFIKRHNEIMAMADDIQSRYKEKAPTSSANTDRSK